MSESLYFIAIVPPEGIQAEITALKQRIAALYGSKHALNAPPHITLHMPFKWKNKKRDQLIQVMQQLNDGLVPFEVELDGFGFFEPRVVFVNVMENEALYALQKGVVTTCKKELKLVNGNYRNQAFHPHVTIGFRDLKKPKFYEAKAEFQQRSYRKRFSVSEVSLLAHDSTCWHITKY